MIFVFIGLASIVLSLLMLWAMGKFSVPEPGAKSSGKHRWLRLLPILLVLAVGGLYWGFLANQNAEKPGVLEGAGAQAGGEMKAKGSSPGDLNSAVKKLAEKMRNDPNNGEGWLLLAKTYSELRQFAEAADAYEKAAAILPADASMLADWADAYVMARDQKWNDQARKIVKRALAIDPKHAKTLALAGSEAFDRGDYKGAIEFWKRMKAAAPTDSMYGKLADDNIAEANNMLSGNKAAVAPVAEIPAVAGSVTISPKLRGKINAEDTVFIIAKTADGAGPPLAVKRFKGSDLPLQFRLDDSAAIMPGRLISQSSEVVVTAKVSKSGQADQQAGDIYALPVKARLGVANLKIELDQLR